MTQEEGDHAEEVAQEEVIKVDVVDGHMTSEFEQSALEICMEAVKKFKHLKDIAFHVKHSYDKKYPGSGKATEGVYHCIVGKNFASKFLDEVLAKEFQNENGFVVGGGKHHIPEQHCSVVCRYEHCSLCHAVNVHCL